MDSRSITQQAKRRGFNLIEAAIVLGVVGLVIGGIWVAASAVMEKQKQSDTLKMTFLAVDKMRNIMKQVPTNTYPDEFDLNPIAVGIGAIPENRKTPFGDVNIAIDKDVREGFSIQLVGLNKSTCVVLSRHFSDRAKLYDLIRIRLWNPAINYITFPVDETAIANSCAVASTLSIQFGWGG